MNQNLGRLLVRLVIGGLFVGHGTQKLQEPEAQPAEQPELVAV